VAGPDRYGRLDASYDLLLAERTGLIKLNDPTDSPPYSMKGSPEVIPCRAEDSKAMLVNFAFNPSPLSLTITARRGFVNTCHGRHSPITAAPSTVPWPADILETYENS
jgi:hypothetical protein